MISTMACEALHAGRCLELRYDGFSRLVEVHAVGRSRAGHLVMRVWQVSGGSASGQPTGWKLLRLDEVRSAHVAAVASMAPRRGFKRTDPAMAGGILCEA